MILVDTSVWIDHLRRGLPTLTAALDEAQVLTHPFVVGELACGNLKPGSDALLLMQNLPKALVASDSEALEFIERHELMGRGIGYVDVHLLASVAITGATTLWTHDVRLASIAAAMGLANAGC
ncbi:MAG: type II toxin-antitoxin system VapC family toxin [Casimicrobiaceae bacterium]